MFKFICIFYRGGGEKKNKDKAVSASCERIQKK